MDSLYDEFLLEEQGYIICPISFPEYQNCDGKCLECDTYKEFTKYIEEKYKLEN